MNRKVFAPAALAIALLLPQLWAQQVQVEELVLENGLKFLFVPRHGDPNVAAGWIAKVGSADERPGITGISHLFEHMMFKGTHTIGASDVEENLRVMDRMDEVKSQLFEEERELIRQLRLGEISDLKDPANRSPRHQELLAEFEELTQKEADSIITNEFDRIYTQGGASSMNATTNRDFTLYFINVPANKLELWFWMESDRLLNPVFREFYAERDVVYEERRLRTDSTPTGKFREQFESMFWTSHPYGWPVVGWPSDLDGITREEALDYFALNYAPNNLVACLVGDFDTDQAKQLAERYFGRLKRSKRDPEPVRTREVDQQAEKRMVAYADTNPEVEIRYHTVAIGHLDDPALTVAGALLSGRTGRLYKSLVLEQEVANRASASQRGMKWAGYFGLGAVAKPGRDPKEVEEALYAELEKLKDEPVGERELQKIKNRFAANNFRRIENNFFLMVQLLVAEGNGSWQSFNENPKKVQAVTAADVQRVAQKYLQPEQRAVALYYTKAAQGPEDPLLAGLSQEEKDMVNQFKGRVAQMPAETIQRVLSRMEAAGDSMPEQQRKLAPVIKKMLQQRLEELEKEGGQQ